MTDRRRQEDAAAAAAALPSLFYVKHHNDEVTILNSKCPTAVLQDRLRKLAGPELSNIKPGTASTTYTTTTTDNNNNNTAGNDPLASSSSSSSSSVNVDLILAPAHESSSGGKGSSKSSAEVVGLSDKLEQSGTAVYANTFIASRATYVLLAYYEDEDGIKNYRPIWRSVSNGGDDSERLAAVLDGKTAEEKKKIGTKKGGKK